MPSKKKKYNARFPAGRIKKIMQTDEEVGKVAQAVPVIISKALEMFIESLLKKSMHITQSRNAKTLTPSHMKQCILSENRFDFLKDLVKNIPDASIQEDNENNALADSNVNFGVVPDELGNASGGYFTSSIEKPREPDYTIPSPANFYVEQSSSRIPVIQHGPNVSRRNSSKHNFEISSSSSTEQKSVEENSQLQVTIASKELSATSGAHCSILNQPTSTYSQSSTSAGDNLCIDEDYDN